MWATDLRPGAHTGDLGGLRTESWRLMMSDKEILLAYCQYVCTGTKNGVTASSEQFISEIEEQKDSSLCTRYLEEFKSGCQECKYIKSHDAKKEREHNGELAQRNLYLPDFCNLTCLWMPTDAYFTGAGSWLAKFEVVEFV